MSDDAILLAQIDARMNRLDAALNKAVGASNTSARRIERRFQTMNSNLDRSFQRLQRGAAAALGALGVGISAQAFGRLLSDSLQLAETLDDTARTANIGVEAFQEWRFAATQNGVATERFDRALQQLNSNVGIFINTGGGPAARAFQQLGLAQDIMSGELRGTENILMAVVEAFDNIPDAAQRAGLASQIMGQRYGREMTRIMSQGSDTIRQYAGRARELGLVLGGDVVRRGAEANATLRAMRESVGLRATQEVLEHTDALLKLGEALADIAGWGVRMGAGIGDAIENFRLHGRAENPMQRRQALGRAAGELEQTMGRGQAAALDMGGPLARALTEALGASAAAAEMRRIQQEFGSGFANLSLEGNALMTVAADLRRMADDLRAPPPPPPPPPPGGITNLSTDTQIRARRALALTRERMALEFLRTEAEARGDAAAARRLQRELDLMARTEAYRNAEIRDAETMARADQQRLNDLEDNALAQENLNRLAEARRQLIDDQLGIEIELERLRGNSTALAQLERELYVRARISELTGRGLDSGEATGIATREAEAMDGARRQGQYREFFRTSFRDGLLGALDGNAKEAFSSWLRDAATRGLGRALDALADKVFDLFSGAGGGGGIAGSVGRLLGFGGGRATGGPVRPGKMYMVGERGPEPFVPSVPGQIIPNGQLDGGRSAPQHITVRLKVDEGPMFAARVEGISADIAGRAVPVSVDLSRQAVGADLSRRAEGRLR